MKPQKAQRQKPRIDASWVVFVAALAFLVVANACVHEDGVVAGAHQVGLHGED
jgi:hypothetical protein